MYFIFVITTIMSYLMIYKRSGPLCSSSISQHFPRKINILLSHFSFTWFAHYFTFVSIKIFVCLTPMNNLSYKLDRSKSRRLMHLTPVRLSSAPVFNNPVIASMKHKLSQRSEPLEQQDQELVLDNNVRVYRTPRM